MKKFTSNFFSGRRLFDRILLKIGLSLVSILMIAAAVNAQTITAVTGDLTNLKADSEFVVTTDVPVVPGSGLVSLVDVTNGNATLQTYQASNANVTISSEKNDDDLYEITIDFSEYLSEETEYDLVFDENFVQKADDATSSNATVTFDVTVGDYTAPKLVDTNFFNPETGETKGVLLTNTLTVTFDEDVKVADGGVVYIYTDNGTANGDLYEIVTAENGKLTTSGAVLTIDPAREFKGETKYYVTIPEGSIVDDQSAEAAPFDESAYDNENPYAGWLTHDMWFFTTLDTSAPVFSNVSADNIAADQFDVFFNLNEEGTAWFLAVPKDADAPIAADFTEANGMEEVAVDDVTETFSVTLDQYFDGTDDSFIEEAEEYDVYAFAKNTAAVPAVGTPKKVLSAVKTLDVTEPVVEAKTPEHQTWALEVADADTIYFEFDDDDLVKGAGTIEIWSYDADTNYEMVYSIDVTDETVVITNDSLIVPVDPTVYESGITYFVLVPDGFIKDSSQNEVAGYTTNSDWRFSIEDFVHPTYEITWDQSDLELGNEEFEVSVVFSEAVYQDQSEPPTPYTTSATGIDEILFYVWNASDEDYDLVNPAPAVTVTGNNQFYYTVPAVSEGQYKITVKGENIYDAAGNESVDGEETYTLKDYAKPVASLEKTELQPSDNVVINWTEKVFKAGGGELTAADIENIVIFRKGADLSGSLVNATYSISEDGESFIIDPANDFTGVGDTYYVRVGAETVQDEAANKNALWSATFIVADFKAPTAKLSTASDSEVKDGDLIHFDEDLLITFNELVQRKDGGSVASAASAADLINFKENGVNVDFTATWTTAGTVITIPAASLKPNKTYTVSIGKSLEDAAAGNDFAGKTVEFSTLSDAAPAVDTHTPDIDETAVAAKAPIRVVFDRDIEKNDFSGILVEENSVNKVTTSGIKVENGNTLVIPHADFIKGELTVTVTIPADAVYSKGTTIGNDEYIFSFVTFDDDGPVVDVYFPNIAADNAEVDADLYLSFDETVVVGTGSAVIRNAETDVAVQTLTEADLEVDEDFDNIINFKLKADLDYLTGYYVEISSGLIKDDEGNAYVGITGTTWNFTTEDAPAFEVTESVPANGDDKVSLTDNFVITLNRAADASTASTVATIKLEVSAPGADSWSIVFNDAAEQSNFVFSGETLTINPVDNLVADRDYKLTLSAGIVEDEYGKELVEEVIYFYTYDNNAPEYTSTPEHEDEDVPVSANVVLEWDETPIYSVTGIAFTAANIKNNGIVLIKDGTDYAVTISGNVWTINPDTDFDDETPITVAVKGSVIEDVEGNVGSDDSFTFTTEDNTIVDPSAVATADGTSVEFTVTFNEEGTVYYAVQKADATAPTATELIGLDNAVDFEGDDTSDEIEVTGLDSDTEYILYLIAVDASSNENVSDVVEVTFSTLDITDPVATIVSPENGEENVDADTDLVLSFAGESTVNITATAKVVIRNVETDVTALSFTLTPDVNAVWDGEDKEVTITLPSALSSNTEYYVEIDAGAFTDNAGNESAAIADWSFTVKDTEAPLLLATTPDIDVREEIVAGSTIVMKFNEDVQAGTGVITVYKSIWPSSPDPVFEVINVGDLTFGADSTVSFNLENTPAEQAVYYIKVDAGVIEDLAGNPYVAAFTGSDWDFRIKDLTAPSLDDYEFVTYDSFVVATLKVASVISDDEVPIDNNILVVFSENIYKAPEGTAFTNTTIDDIVVLKDADGNIVEVDVLFDGANQILVVPDEDLVSETEYTLTISPVVDSKLNVSEEIKITFTTEDNTAPVPTFNPVAESINVDINGVVTIKFNEPVYDDVVQTSELNKYGVPVLDENINDLVTYVVSNEDGTVSGTAIDFEGTMSDDNMTMTITPTDELTSLGWFKVTLGAATVVDYAENANAEASTYFQVQDTEAPEVIAAGYSPQGAVKPDVEMTITFNEDVQLGTGSFYIRNYVDGTLVEEIVVSDENVTVDDDVVTIAHADLPLNMKFYVAADAGAIKDLSENEWAGIERSDIDEWSFSTGDAVNPDLFGADALTPAIAATNVSLTADLEIIFDKKIRLETDPAETYYIVIYNEDWTPFQQIEVNSANVTLDGVVAPVYQADRVAVISHMEFEASSKYFVRVEKGAFEDLNGNQFEGIMDNTWYFTTEDGLAPSIEETIPDDDATAVNVHANLQITFDRDVLGNSAGMIYIYEQTDATGILVETIDPMDASKVTISGPVVIINPAATLEVSKTYYVIIDEGAFTNTSSQQKPFAGIITTEEWNFTTSDVATYTIAQVQGSGDVSPVENQTVEMATATVTAIVDGEGFFMQDANAAWSGIWVAYAEAAANLEVGDGVDVTGTVAETNGVTTIVADVVTVVEAVLTVEAVEVASPSAVQAEMYESVLVVVGGAGTSGMGENNQFEIFYELNDSVVVSNMIYTSPADSIIAGNFFDVTGVVNGAQDAYTLEPRMAEDIVDVTKATPAIIVPGETVKFNVYPNPFNDGINIDNHDKLTRVIITNIAGQRVMDVEYPERRLSTSNLVSGVYVISLFNEDGMVKSDRIVKR